MYVLDQKKSEHPIVSLACAHPAKFGDAIEKATGKKPIIPDQLKNVFEIIIFECAFNFCFFKFF